MSDTHQLAVQLVDRLQKGGFLITTVESCTGGALANAITNVPGSGDVFKHGFVTYSNEAKIALGVPETTIQKHSVYSPQTALAMAVAGGQNSAVNARITVGITGTLNRTDPDNPESSQIGDVYIAIVRSGNPIHQEKLVIPTSLSRSDAKAFVVTHVLKKILELV